MTLDTALAGDRGAARRRRPRARRGPRGRRSGALMAVDTSVLAFVRGTLRPRPHACSRSARGRASSPPRSAAMGWEVVAVDPAADSTPGVEPIPLLEARARRRRSTPRSRSCRCTTSTAGRVVRAARRARSPRRGPCGRRVRRRALRRARRRWQGAQRAAAGRTAPEHTRGWVGDIRHHMHPVTEIRARSWPRASTSASRSAARTSTAGTSTRPCAPSRSGSSAAGALPATGARLVGVRR